MAFIRKGYKHNGASVICRRKFIVPENGGEANLFWKYRNIIRGRTSNWHCAFIYDGVRKEGSVTVFRYGVKVPDEDIFQYTMFPIDEGERHYLEKGFHINGVDDRRPFPESKNIEYLKPNHIDQW